MNIEQEIRAQIEKNKGLKLAVGEINNHLSILEGLLRNERDDVQKQVNEAYQRGLDDAWEAARKISVIELNGGLSGKDMMKIYGTMDVHKIYDDNTASEAIAKLKAYEEKAEDEIKVGDEVNWLGDCFIVTRIFQPHNMKEQCDGIDDDGCVYHDVLMDDLEKTGKRYDIASILKEMQND